MSGQIPARDPENQSLRPRPVPDPNWFQVWYEFQQRAEEELLAELRRQIGPDGDLKAAYREWYEVQMREHTEGFIQMLRNLHKAQRGVRHEEESP
jgi:hypothetical protein